MLLIYTEDLPFEVVERTVHSWRYNKFMYFRISLTFFLPLTFLKQRINCENNSNFLCGINQIPDAFGIGRMDQSSQGKPKKPEFLKFLLYNKKKWRGSFINDNFTSISPVIFACPWVCVSQQNFIYLLWTKMVMFATYWLILSLQHISYFVTYGCVNAKEFFMLF